jgi:HEAT repeat protein
MLVYMIWRASRAYRQALVEALCAGQPQMFYDEEQPFGGLHTDAAAVSAAIRGLSDPDASIRRVSAEIVSHLPVSEAVAALVSTLGDEDAQVRIAALKGLTSARAASALLDISTSLSDPDPDVRTQAIETIRQLAVAPHEITELVEPLLSDGDLLVTVQAALTLLCTSRHARAREILHAMTVDSNPLLRTRALNALGECGDQSAFELALTHLNDVQPMVRKAAAGALVGLNPQEALSHLILHLNDDDNSVRRALAKLLNGIGELALEALVEALSNPAFEDGALMALEQIPAHKAAVKIRAYAKTATQNAMHYHRLARGLAQAYTLEEPDDRRVQLLFESLSDKAESSGLNALRALGMLVAREAMTVAVENLLSRDAGQRANALETLESAGEREIIRPLLALWESGEPSSVPLPQDWLIDLLDDQDAWLRACSVLVAVKTGNAGLIEKLKTMSCSDPDEIVRNLLLGEPAMDTLATLSLMERILFLRHVPLFASLPPTDLKQVAAIANEVLFADGQVLVRQGEPGAGMYIVVSGEVRVLITVEGQKESREVARRCSGDYIGEMSIISQEPRMATLIADGAVRALCINQKQFEGILRERPETSLTMIRILGQRLKEASERSTIS